MGSCWSNALRSFKGSSSDVLDESIDVVWDTFSETKPRLVVTSVGLVITFVSAWNAEIVAVFTSVSSTASFFLLTISYFGIA
jgi:hypothetical protein